MLVRLEEELPHHPGTSRREIINMMNSLLAADDHMHNTLSARRIRGNGQKRGLAGLGNGFGVLLTAFYGAGSLCMLIALCVEFLWSQSRGLMPEFGPYDSLSLVGYSRNAYLSSCDSLQYNLSVGSPISSVSLKILLRFINKVTKYPNSLAGYHQDYKNTQPKKEKERKERKVTTDTLKGLFLGSRMDVPMTALMPSTVQGRGPPPT